MREEVVVATFEAISRKLTGRRKLVLRSYEMWLYRIKYNLFCMDITCTIVYNVRMTTFLPIT